MGSSSKSKRLAIRIAAADKARLARAAAVQRRSVSEFVLATSREAAEHVLGEQTRFRLSPAGSRAFVAALDAPAREISALRHLFSRRSVLEREPVARAAAFYARYGFRPSPSDPLYLFLLTKDMKKTLGVR